MSLFDRFTQPRRQQYSTKVVTPTETKADPVTPLPETPVELIQICAACGKPGAINQLSISYFGYITLPFVYLCNDCESKRITGKQQHYTDLHRRPIAAQETLEVSALEAKKPRVRKVALVEQRKPSGPLEERTHNLATGS